ncbi:hypothetical protein C8J56DRAFT_940282 [Mycena floridula]|nr:hypothetical protein C8J56DRAFT_940282 [Mycena floridula]
MILPLIFLGFGLIHGSSTGVEALEFTLLSNPVAFDTAAKFHWDAIVTDPDSFSVEVGQDGVTLVPFSDVVARGGALQGSIVTPPLETPGPYKFRAITCHFYSGQTFAEIDFPVSESSTAVETTSKQLVYVR